MLSRTEQGKLRIDFLDMEIFFGDLFDICKTKDELDFVCENLTGCIEKIYEETLEEKNLNE